MRILILKSVPFAKEGTTTVVCNFVNSLWKHNCVFDAVSINENTYYKDFFEKKGGSFFVIKRRFFNCLKYISKVAKIISRGNYDVVHIHGNSHTLVLELLACKIGKAKKTIVHAHSTSCKHKFLHRLLAPLFTRLCNIRVACGIEAGKFMFGDHPFTVIKNGIEADLFKFSQKNREDIRKRFNIDNKTFLFGHIGSFYSVKNHSFLIDLLLNEFNLSNDTNYKLMLVGGGELLISIKKKCEEHNILDKVIFVGAVADVYKYLSAIDLILMPSFFEGFPLSLVEEQANGLSCIVSDRITKDINITGNVFFLSIDNGTGEWAQAIRHFDIYNRADASDAAVKSIKANGFDINDEAKRLLDIYNQ